MEWGCLASSPSTPSTFINKGTLHSYQSHKTHIKSFPTRTTYYSHSSNNKNARRTSPLSVEASNQSFTTRNPPVNSNWNDGFNHPAVSSPSWLPGFEKLDPEDMLLRQRIVFLGSQVDDYTADFIIGQLLYLDAEDSKKDIKLFINSPGGSVTAAMGIYDTMKLCKADVSTVCMGLAASMGAFILATGTKGKRFCMPNARVMILQQPGSAQGEGIEVAIQVKEHLYHEVKVKKILSRVTGKSEEQIERDTKGEYFMNPWEAKEYGLVDEVIDDGKPGLVAPLADSSPPPKVGKWFLWGNSGGKRPKANEMPSEEKISQNGKVGGSGADEVEQEKETPAPV